MSSFVHNVRTNTSVMRFLFSSLGGLEFVEEFDTLARAGALNLQHVERNCL